MKNKKWIIPVLAAVTALLLVTGFFLLRHNRQQRRAEAISAGKQAVIVSHDKTVLPDFVYNSDSIAEDSIRGEKQQRPIPESSADIEEMAQQAELIVRGSVSFLSYTFMDGLAYTMADVTVTEVLKGSLQQGDIISVYYPGGYASVNDYSEFMGEKVTGGGYYRVKAGNVPEPEMGRDAVFFLSEPAAGSPVPKGAYSLHFGERSVLPFDEQGRSLSPGEDKLSFEELLEIIGN